MNKEYLTNIKDALPNFFKLASGILSSEVTAESVKDAVDHTGGLAGLLIKIFGKGFIDKRYEKIKANKLENFGFNVS